MQELLIGLQLSRFFWSLIEQPVVIILEMLQHANQYVTIEALVAGKHEKHKRPRAEQSRGQPLGPSRIRLNQLELPLPRPPLLPLSSSRTKIFLHIRERGLLRAPNPMKTPCELKDRSKNYRFHHDYDHDTEECNDIKNQIEEPIRRGHLGCYIKKQRESSPHPSGPVEK